MRLFGFILFSSIVWGQNPAATAVIGATMGVVLGVSLGWIVVKALVDQGLNTFAVSIGSVVGFTLMAMVFAVVAAWFPSRRAAKADILKLCRDFYAGIGLPIDDVIAAFRPVPKENDAGMVSWIRDVAAHRDVAMENTRRLLARGVPVLVALGGTTVGINGRAVRRAPLQLGDRIELGGAVLVVGQSVTRLEDPPLVTGRGRYAAAVSFPHQLHMRVVRSPIAHGRLNGIDAAAALALPGVHAVWTHADIAHLPKIGFRLTRIEELARYQQPVLADGTHVIDARAIDAAGNVDIETAGGRYNLTDVAAAVGLGQLRRLDAFNARRGELAARLSNEPNQAAPTGAGVPVSTGSKVAEVAGG